MSSFTEPSRSPPAGGQDAAVVEFDDFPADLREQRLPALFLAGLGVDAFDLGDHRAVLVVLGGNLAHHLLGAGFVAGGQAGVRQIEGQFARYLPVFPVRLQAIMQDQRFLDGQLALVGSPSLPAHRARP
jgi:hypothetical protein